MSLDVLRQQLGIHRSLAQSLNCLHDSIELHDLNLTFLKTSSKGTRCRSLNCRSLNVFFLEWKPFRHRFIIDIEIQEILMVCLC